MFSLKRSTFFLLFNKYKVTFFWREDKNEKEVAVGLKLALSQMTQVEKDAFLFASLENIFKREL